MGVRVVHASRIPRTRAVPLQLSLSCVAGARDRRSCPSATRWVRSSVGGKGRHLGRLMLFAGSGLGAGTRRRGRQLAVSGGEEVYAHGTEEADTLPRALMQ